MREMIKEMEEKPVEKNEDNRLDLHSLSRKEKRKAKKKQIEETTEGMSKKERRKYLLYYYKERILIITGIVVVLTILTITVVRALRPVTISYVAINCKNPLEFNADAFEDYAKAINKYDGYQIKGETNVELIYDEYTQSYENNKNSQKYINFETSTAAHIYDVVFTNEEGAVYCGMMDIFYPLDKYLEPEYFERIKDRIVMLTGMDGNPGPYAIDISDTEFAKSLNLGYDDIYIGFAGDMEDNHERVKDFIDYLFPAE